jgi:hypothetical protein
MVGEGRWVVLSWLQAGSIAAAQSRAACYLGLLLLWWFLLVRHCLLQQVGCLLLRGCDQPVCTCTVVGGRACADAGHPCLMCGVRHAIMFRPHLAHVPERSRTCGASGGAHGVCAGSTRFSGRPDRLRKRATPLHRPHCTCCTLPMLFLSLQVPQDMHAQVLSKHQIGLCPCMLPISGRRHSVPGCRGAQLQARWCWWWLTLWSLVV